jgi:anti-anti-sigma regulatory factor
MMLDVRSNGEAIVSIEGVFDAEAAARLRAMCLDAARTQLLRTVVVDLRAAREVTPVALGVLVEMEAAPEAPRIGFRGLSERQRRMLRYLSAHRENSQP